MKRKPIIFNGKITSIALACKRKDTPLFPKLIAGFTFVYALSPIDFIPDFLALLGYVDDIVVFPVCMSLCYKLIPQEIISDCEQQVDSMKKEGFRVVGLLLFSVFVMILLNVLKKGW